MANSETIKTSELKRPPSSALSLSPSISENIPVNLIRINSSIVSRKQSITEPNLPVESARASPIELRFEETLSSSDEFNSHSPALKRKRLLSPSRIGPIPEETGNPPRTVKISEYRSPDDAPFESISPGTSPIKLHRYFLISPRTLFALSLFSLFSLAIVLIGFGIATVHEQSKLNYRCPSITYCPKNSSYTIQCNLTSQYCRCYDTVDYLIGCLSQRQYGQGCYRTQECSNQNNLECNMSTYQCQCLAHYMYNGSRCIPMPSYGEPCSVLNDTCDRGLNLTCLSANICSCDTTVTFWNGQYCELYRTVNSPCNPYTAPSGCSTTFTCDNTTKSCLCPSSAADFDGTACLPYSSYLEPCYDSSSCLTSSLLQCIEGVCQCDDSFYYWSPLLLNCIYPKHITLNTACDYQTGCESDFGLRCINNICACEVNSYWTPGNYCDFQSQYNEQCLTAPCLAYTGLICSNTSICTCPIYYYWDGFVCQPQRSFGAFCLADVWCRIDTGMRCRSYTCTCSLCSTCFYDGTRCRDCPTSWQVVTSTGAIQPRVYCYVKVNSYVNWNESWASCLSTSNSTYSATSYFGPTSHLVYIDDTQEMQDLSTFATGTYYDIFIGHTNRYNFTQWFLNNGTKSPALSWCPGINGTFNTQQCSRLLINATCVTNIVCNGWTSRYVCELD